MREWVEKKKQNVFFLVSCLLDSCPVKSALISMTRFLEIVNKGVDSATLGVKSTLGSSVGKKNFKRYLASSHI